MTRTYMTTAEIAKDFGFDPWTIGQAGKLILYTGCWIIDSLDDLDRSVGATTGDLVVCTTEKSVDQLCPTATGMPNYLGAIDHPTGALKRGHRHYYFKKLGV
ncbi:MAG: hypothetical protein ACRC62_01335 [Microcoleus sp.]